MNETPSPSPGQHPCHQCGARLSYAPGTSKLVCEYCGAEQIIQSAQQPAAVEETDYRRFLSETDLSEEQKQQVHTIKCPSCGANSTLRPNLSADRCPYCDTPLVVENRATSTLIKPRYLLPFKIDRTAARQAFRRWLAGLWFAPGTLKLHADNAGKLNGVYVPYWTYDADTLSFYTGERGDDYTERYTETVDGKTVEQTRTHTQWTSVSGSVGHRFDDVLVVASKALPHEQTQALEPWDLHNLTPYDESFLEGFRAETYQVGLEQGFDEARTFMDSVIRRRICADIGGNHQRIHSVNTGYQAVSFKHLLLPIWISAYRYSGKVYRFVINARSGEVQGERPYSWIKISLAVLTAAALAGAIWYLNEVRLGRL